MTAYIFQQIADRGADAGIARDKSNDSRKWYQTAAKKVRKVDQREFMRSDKERLTARMDRNSIGKMYMFYYDAKTKDTLPYWDQFPLVFPIELYKDGFLGINLHYLPPLLRAKLMKALYEVLNNERFDRTTKLKISYDILNSTARYRYFKPCVKRYLFSHVKSRYYFVMPNEWDMAIFLPTERFQKAPKSQVYKDSIAKIG